VLVALSVLLAIAGSWLALGLAFFFRDEAPGRWRRKISSALLMGAAIVSMHYTAMAAASFTPSAIPPDLSHAVSVSALGIAGLSGVPALVLVVTLLTSMVDRLEKQRALLDELFEQAPSAVALLNSRDGAVRINREFTRLFGYTPSEVLGRRLKDLMNCGASQDQACWDLVKRGQRVDAEDACRRKDGSGLDVAVILAPFSCPAEKPQSTRSTVTSPSASGPMMHCASFPDRSSDYRTKSAAVWLGSFMTVPDKSWPRWPSTFPW
jgi:PAS domain S-box-containing protein